MKNKIINKLTIIIEATNYKSISNEVIKSISALEESLSSNQGLKLSLAVNDAPEVVKNKNADYVSPENWDYWSV